MIQQMRDLWEEMFPGEPIPKQLLVAQLQRLLFAVVKSNERGYLALRDIFYAWPNDHPVDVNAVDEQGRSLLDYALEVVLTDEALTRDQQSQAAFKCRYLLGYGAHVSSFKDRLIAQLKRMPMNTNKAYLYALLISFVMNVPFQLHTEQSGAAVRFFMMVTIGGAATIREVLSDEQRVKQFCPELLQIVHKQFVKSVPGGPGAVQYTVNDLTACDAPVVTLLECFEALQQDITGHLQTKFTELDQSLKITEEQLQLFHGLCKSDEGLSKEAERELRNIFPSYYNGWFTLLESVGASRIERQMVDWYANRFLRQATTPYLVSFASASGLTDVMYGLFTHLKDFKNRVKMQRQVCLSLNKQPYFVMMHAIIYIHQFYLFGKDPNEHNKEAFDGQYARQLLIRYIDSYSDEPVNHLSIVYINYIKLLQLEESYGDEMLDNLQRATECITKLRSMPGGDQKRSLTDNVIWIAMELAAITNNLLEVFKRQGNKFELLNAMRLVKQSAEVIIELLKGQCTESSRLFEGVTVQIALKGVISTQQQIVKDLKIKIARAEKHVPTHGKPKSKPLSKLKPAKVAAASSKRTSASPSKPVAQQLQAQSAKPSSQLVEKVAAAAEPSSAARQLSKPIDESPRPTERIPKEQRMRDKQAKQAAFERRQQLEAAGPAAPIDEMGPAAYVETGYSRLFHLRAPFEANVEYYVHIDSNTTTDVGDDQLQAIQDFLASEPSISCRGNCIKPVSEHERERHGLAKGRYYKVKLTNARVSGKQLRMYGKVIASDDPNICIIELSYKFLAGRVTHR